MSRPVQPRREFLRGALRLGLLGGLGGLAAVLAASGRVCLRNRACRHCVVYDRCRLPEREVRS